MKSTGKKYIATIIVVNVCFSCALEPFINSKEFASKHLKYFFTANISALPIKSWSSRIAYALYGDMFLV